MPKLDSPGGPRAVKPLCPEQLARDFGAAAEVTREGVRALYDALQAAGAPEVAAALARWKLLVSGACGHDPDRPSDRIRRLADCYGVPSDELRPAEILFVVHTYYALLVKLLVWQILASPDKLSSPAERIAQAANDNRVKLEMERLESGRVFEDVHLVKLFKEDPFSWYTAAWDERVAGLIRRLAARFGHYDPGGLARNPAGSQDLLGTLYQELFPKRVRHALGEYYTPGWLAGHVLDQAGFPQDPDARLLDPACGSGTFLVMAINRLRACHEKQHAGSGGSQRELCRKILAGVVGFDLNPLAVLSARANYLIAIRDLLRHAGRVEIPVFLRDSILDPGNATGDGPGDDPGGSSDPFGGRFDCVVGNPPWIAWDNLPDDYRQATKPLWQRYGLFTLSGSDARHGGGKKDLSMLMLYASADRYLKDGGRLAMVVTQTLFQTKGAGDGFRRFRLGHDGPWLGVLRVDDMAGFRPFPGAANWTSTILLEKGRPTVYPLPYVQWSLSGEPPEGDCGDRQPGFQQRRCLAEPIDPDRATSPWFVRPPGLKTGPARLVGPSDYQAHLGANSGGANGVYWVRLLEERDGGILVENVAETGKRSVATVRHVVETDLLYPLLRWADVARYHAQPRGHLLLVQDLDTRRGIDEAAMHERYPATYAYLKRFARVLTGRAAYKRYQHRAAFYSMYNVGRYTVAPAKVVWRRMDRRINAAVVEEVDDPRLGRRPVVPQETCVLVAAESSDEAHYLCALLNSAIVGFLVASHSVRGGKGFGTPSMLDYLRLRRFEPENPQHAELAALSFEAHRAAERGDDVVQIQHRIDRLAGGLWALSEQELDVIRNELDRGRK